MNKNQKPWKTIMKRELTAYFTSPVAYIAGALFLVFSGLLFFSTFFLANRAELRSFFEYLPILFSFFIPALTMRVFSEEQKSGTMETLVTLPVTVRDIVVGKFLGAFVSSILLLVPTLFYVLTCVIFSESEVDAGPMFGGYMGAVLLASSFTAIGIYASSITKNQIVAYFISFTVCIVLTGVSIFGPFLPGVVVSFISFISANSHFTSISRGIIDSRDLIYFASLTAGFIALTANQVQNARRR